jgi:hypothetical protein
MAEDRLRRLDLFEAVVYAIYGNWLISFLADKISYTQQRKLFRASAENMVF